MTPLEERFWEKVSPEPNSGCWLWAASEKNGGYGQFWDGERNVRAHRWAYETYRGPIPSGLQMDHLCRVRCCVNPFHLEAVTQQENIRRGDAGKYPTAGLYRKNKTHCPKGHEYNARNTYIYNGWRFCRECNNISSARRRAKAREAQ